MNQTLKNLLPHVLAYIFLFVVTLFMFKPAAIDGKVLQQGDNLQAGGMQAELKQYKQETGVYPIWTNAAFGGMPSYQILFVSKNLVKYPFNAMIWGKSMKPPHKAALLMMFGFYLLMVIIGIDLRIAVLGAVGFGLSAYYMDLLEAGHSTKYISIAYMAPMLAGVILAFRKKYLLGGALFAFFLSLQLYANHLQITYYFFICLGIYGLMKIFETTKTQDWAHLGKAAGVLVLATGLALSTGLSRLWTTWEYSKETIRGKSELTEAVKQQSSGGLSGEDGLSKEYVFGWSYGILETFNLIIPNYVGGSSNKNFAAEPGSATLSALQKMGNPNLAQTIAQRTSHYWGPQTFTGGPAYLGIIFAFLFFLGAFLVKKPIKWWAIASAILTIMFAWGSHFAVFNYAMYDYFPLFNKFRAVTMALGLTTFFVAFLGMLGLNEFFKKEVSLEEKTKALKLAGASIGGLILLGIIMSFGLDYGTTGSGIPEEVAAALREDRAALLMSDAIRSLVLAGLAFGAMWFYLKKSFHPLALVAVLGILMWGDAVTIANRFISEEDWLDKQATQNFVAPTEVDLQIKQDPDLHYRVADFRRGAPWSNGFTGYHHKSIGGYHAAKLMRLQELIEQYLGDPNKNSHIYGMLNVKYYISRDGQGQERPSVNPDALGNAWFVNEYEIVPDGDTEFKALETLKPGEKAVIQQKYADQLEGFNIQVDSNATIKLTSYHPDKLVYQSNANSEQLAVFSEIYYPSEKGWKLFIDGEPAEMIKVNFILRAARIPAGSHEIEMRFEPTSFYTGETITLIGSILVLGFFIGGLFMHFKNNELPNPNNLPSPEAKKESSQGSSRRRKSTKKKK